VNLRGSTWDVGLKRCVSYFRTTPHPAAVTTRIVPSLVAIVTITGWEVDRDHTIDGENPHLGCRNSMKFLYSTDQFEWRYIPKMYPRKKKCLVRNSNFQLPFSVFGCVAEQKTWRTTWWLDLSATVNNQSCHFFLVWGWNWQLRKDIHLQTNPTFHFTLLDEFWRVQSQFTSIWLKPNFLDA